MLERADTPEAIGPNRGSSALLDQSSKLWAIPVAAIDPGPKANGFPSYFDPDPETGEAYYTGALKAIAERICAKRKTKAPAEHQPKPSERASPLDRQNLSFICPGLTLCED
jgi:hypothetical protein